MAAAAGAAAGSPLPLLQDGCDEEEGDEDEEEDEEEAAAAATAAGAQPRKLQLVPRRRSPQLLLRVAAALAFALAGALALARRRHSAAPALRPHLDHAAAAAPWLGLREEAASGGRLCYDSQLSMDFGRGITKFDLDRGSGTFTRNCPFGSPSPDGKIRFACLDSGLWNMTEQSCYSCPALRERFTFAEGQSKEIALSPGGTKHVHREACSFDDGTVYSTGSIEFECSGGRWRHTATTCSETLCRPGNVTLNFFGAVGEVHLPVPGSSETAALACPRGAPSRGGAVHLRCEANEDPQEAGSWKFVNQTCQTCNPTSLILTVGKAHKQAVDLPAAMQGASEQRPCTFDDGSKVYAQGGVNYKCAASGWKLENSTCRDWTCPGQTAVMQMEYHSSDGQAMTGQAHLRLEASGQGRHELPCPKGTLNTRGKVAFDCQADGSWRVHSVHCGGNGGDGGHAKVLRLLAD